MSDRIWVDGREQTMVSARDRGLQYGDGLFETMAVIDGQIRHLRYHLERLLSGCARLGIEGVDQAQMTQELVEQSRAVTRGVLKLIITRGIGARGYRPPATSEPTRIASLSDWPNHSPEWAAAGVAVRYCRTPLGENPILAGLKHLNRLEQVLARSEWSDPTIAEGLMLDGAGHIIGGTMTNVFIVQRRVLLTPRVDRCGVAGVMRRTVLEAAQRLGIEARECTLARTDIESADEVFLTNALIGIWPVRAIERRSFSLGAVARELLQAL